MKTKKHLIAITFILVAIAGIIGSTTPKKAFDDNSNGWLPPDFSPKNGTLLIEKGNYPKKQVEKIESFMKEKYPYKYEFVDAKTWREDPRFQDKQLYPFILIPNLEIRERSDINSNRTQRIYMFDFYFVDRVKDKSYPKSGIGSSWASTTLEAIIKKVLEKNS